jgi:hypothetical protein
MNGIKSKACSNAAMFCNERKRFIKMLTAMRTVVTTFPVMQEGMFTHNGESFDYRSTIIMDFIRQSLAMWAGTNLTFYASKSLPHNRAADPYWIQPFPFYLSGFI